MKIILVIIIAMENSVDLVSLQKDKHELQNKHDELTVKMIKVKAFIADCQQKIKAMIMEQDKIKCSMDSIDKNIQTKEFECMLQQFSENPDLLVEYYYKQNFHHPFVDRFNLPSFVENTYFQLSRDQLRRVIEFCLERKMILTMEGKNIFKISFVLHNSQLQHYKYIIHKLQEIQPNIQISGDIQATRNNGVGNGSYIEVHLVRRVPYSNTVSHMLEYYKRQKRLIMAQIIFKELVPILLFQLICQKYIGTRQRRHNIVLTVRQKSQ